MAKKKVVESGELFGLEVTERSCNHCNWTGYPTKSVVGEFETYLCPNNHVVLFRKTTVTPVSQPKKVSKKAEVRSKLILEMGDFAIGRNKELNIKTNTVYHENNLVTFSRMDDDFLDLIVTSPPYDDLRAYEGIEWDYKKIMLEAHRTLKPGGVMVWIVGDGIDNDGSESGNSYRQTIFGIDIGLILHDTMIYKKKSPAYPAGELSKRYTQIFEFAFVFSKGTPKTVNLIKDKKNLTAGSTTKNGSTVKTLAARDNIWEYGTGSIDTQKDSIAKLHPAIFPEMLAADHVISWSNEGDIVYDCFAGSGTTLKVSKSLKRLYIGSEITKKYVDIINERLNTLEL